MVRWVRAEMRCGRRSLEPIAETGSWCSPTLAARHLLQGKANGHVRLVDAPFVEGAVAAAVMSSAGQSLDDVAKAAEEARGASKF